VLRDQHRKERMIEQRHPTVPPGTVSKILWHFAGGPTWNINTHRQNEKPKPSKEAYRNVKSILKERRLRLGNYREVVNVVIPERQKFISTTRQFEKQTNVPIEIESSAVCCLSDIPIPHLQYHSARYGRFAIGFHRDAIIHHGFNPVFYALENAPTIRSTYQGLSSLDASEPFEIMNQIQGFEVAGTIGADREVVEMIESAISDARESLQDLVAFVKTFGRHEFGTIYCEREWRSISPYAFDVDHVAMIVLPKQGGGTEYFKEFASRIAKKLSLPRRLPIVPWDDLVGH
jgi:Putative abortive phage resistance protein AbiGi, antitoxin